MKENEKYIMQKEWLNKPKRKVGNAAKEVNTFLNMLWIASTISIAAGFILAIISK